ncbi:phage minor tail protein L [Shewanella sp. 1180_01]|uniref:phage minor tail protein L n=1 Tax=Shewanella sp. 1180_01 TaxID=2604451 RepID=UPI004063012F
MRSADIQTLEPGNEVILYGIDGTAFGADILRFHAHNIPYSDADLNQPNLPARIIHWQGEQYSAWPAQLEGVEVNSDGSPSTPTLTVANIDGSISALCLYFQNMEQAKVTIRRTLAKYLDATNFPSGNSEADPTQEAVEIWYVDKKVNEDNVAVTFELSNPADLSGQKIGRQMTAYCSWCQRGAYRGADCGYTGEAMFTEDDEPTDNPALDQCSGTIAGCTLRFGENEELPHGGFPSVRLIR